MTTKLGDAITQGHLPFNAELDIDWQTRDVKFNYPQAMPGTWGELEHMKDIAYFSHAFVVVLAVAATFINYMCLFKLTESVFTADGIAAWVMYFGIYKFAPAIAVVAIIMTYGWMMFNLMGFLWLFGTISIWVHRFSPKARGAFPDTNAWLKQPFLRRSKIDLSKQFGKGWMRVGDLIIFPKISPVMFELTIPQSLDVEIRRIYTVCTSDKPTVMTGNFWLFIKLMHSDINQGEIEVRY